MMMIEAVRSRSRTTVGLLIWSHDLRNLAAGCLEVIAPCQVIVLQRSTDIVPAEFLSTLSRLDILITEAYNPNKFKNAEGFRLAMTIVNGHIPVLPLIIFKSLDKEYLEHPYFIDYSTFHMLDEKIDELQSMKQCDLKPFAIVAGRYPELLRIPVHRRVVR